MHTLLESVTVLVVDDDADTCEVLRSALEEAGAAVVVAGSVDEALDICHRAPPHAVVADIRLGGSDGYTLIKAIRKLNVEYRGFTPAVAVTGFASPEDEQMAISSGFNAYLSKPVDPSDVVHTLVDILRSWSYRAA
jgi:CheY-like chemotaxis protein